MVMTNLQTELDRVSAFKTQYVINEMQSNTNLEIQSLNISFLQMNILPNYTYKVNT